MLFLIIIFIGYWSQGVLSDGNDTTAAWNLCKWGNVSDTVKKLFPVDTKDACEIYLVCYKSNLDPNIRRSMNGNSKLTRRFWLQNNNESTDLLNECRFGGDDNDENSDGWHTVVIDKFQKFRFGEFFADFAELLSSLGIDVNDSRCHIKCAINSTLSTTVPYSSAPPPPFNRWAISKTSLDCARVLHNDKDYIREMASMRITFSDPHALDMDCERGIRWRNFFPNQTLPCTDDDDGGDYPLAQARVVYRDYVFLEMELAAAYSPNNWYCYALDAKADALFKSRMRKLAECLPNVIVAEREFNTDSAGHNMNRAHHECMKILAVPGKRWNYVALLQNHDTAIKTNRQMVQIYKWLHGANDVAQDHMYDRVNMNLDWSFDAIGLFRNNKSRNTQTSSNGYPPKLVFSKGFVQSSLTREMVLFILNDLDLSITMDRLDAGDYGIDEMLIPTINAADAIQAPGGFTHICMDREKKQPTAYITRASIWHDGDECSTHYMRHYNCIFGLEDLPGHMQVWPHLFANKFQPGFDFGAIACWYEAMHNRTYDPIQSGLAMASLRQEIYEDLATVRFQRFKKRIEALNKDAPIITYKNALKLFNCTSKHPKLT